MPITTTTFPYFFTIVVFILGSACFYLPSLLLLGVIFLRLSPFDHQPNSSSNPTSLAQSVAARSFHGGQVNPTPNDYQRGEGGTLAAFSDHYDGLRISQAAQVIEDSTKPEHRMPTQHGQTTADMKRELDLIDEQFRRNNKTPADVYPPNKILVRCKSCRAFIDAGEGYQHYKVGVRATFCRDCHSRKGLPLRDDDVIEEQKSDTIGGEGASSEV